MRVYMKIWVWGLGYLWTIVQGLGAALNVPKSPAVLRAIL